MIPEKNVSRETSKTETIFAVATPPGRSALAVIRLTGPDVLTALTAMTGRETLPPRQACLLKLREFAAKDISSNRVALTPYDAKNPIIDQALVIFFPGPASETGEDCLEIHPHGSPNVIASLCHALGQLPNFRLAEPGEFIRRAFMNGKMDLTAIEGVADLLAADTDRQRRQALRQMQGGLRQKIEQWRGNLLRALAYIEASIDFVDEELPGQLPAQARQIAAQTQSEIGQALASSHQGEIVRTGFQIALVGAPNVGKSTLLNHLASREAAIVSPIAGTTRDAISVDLDWSGFRVTLTDTAGLRASEDVIEKIGMAKSRQAAAAADLLLVMVEAHDPPELSDEILAILAQNPNAILVVSKCDFLSDRQGENILSQLRILTKHDAREFFCLALPPNQPNIAAKNCENLIAVIVNRIKRATQLAEDGAVITRQRHRQALEIVNNALLAVGGTDRQDGLEITAESLRRAVTSLDKITGRVAFDDMMSLIFGEFCLGK
ncbi:MAG: tRNA uridine-5-carboxymethylaminomethyl(34) synthesis GTPase MnmE [Candidatus Symbiobacter sp.]|nr:tRNA uridine-5-carboxymethylaminomethyl(34) synthesis GTPase MnmE [Candidatus Symbiobacter sp.]